MRRFMAVLFVSVLTGCDGGAFQTAAQSSVVQSKYRTEYDWALGEISADIAEMAALAAHNKTIPARVALPAGTTPWNPDALVPIADQLFGSSTDAAPRGSIAPAYGRLTDLTAVAIVNVSAAISNALKQNMRSAEAHEAAALALGAFGLREAADVMSDVRWTLNRITAHLAVASALRRGAEPGIDGRLARATLFALADRHRTALGVLSSLSGLDGDGEAMAWTRALRMRVTQDWRLLQEPAQASRLEKLEYFRARRVSFGSWAVAGPDLERLGEEGAADFARIVQHYPFDVVDGNEFVTTNLVYELVELDAVHRLVREGPLPKDLPPATINARASRLVVDGNPVVIPWGAWAEFAQRHIGMAIHELDYHERHTLARPQVADKQKPAVDAYFKLLTQFPLAAMQRNIEYREDIDPVYLPQAAALANRSPELIGYWLWELIENNAKSVTNPPMPQRRTWFTPPTPEVPYEAGRRVRVSLRTMPRPMVERLVDEANGDIWLLTQVLDLVPPPAPELMDKALNVLRARAGYDKKAIDGLVSRSRDNAERIEWRRRGCAILGGDCLLLGDLLAEAGRDDEAAAEYERAWKDPQVDRVRAASYSGWMVRYYERKGRLDRALEVAEQAGEAYSSRGLLVLAQVYERRGRLDDAEKTFLAEFKRYPMNKAKELTAFYYRQAVLGKKEQYRERWEKQVRTLFPNGLQPLPPSMPTAPAKGVYVSKDSERSRRVNLHAGDIIVGLDGWLVEDWDQYRTIAKLVDEDAPHKITAWRGGGLFTVQEQAYMSMELESYPAKNQ